MEFIKKAALISTLTLFSTLAFATNYHVDYLVSDGLIPADHTDPHLINPWGIAFNVTSKAVVVNNGSGLFTAYDGLGQKLPLVVTIPPAPGTGNLKGQPTAAVSNDTNGWVVSKNGVAWQSAFIFVTEDGTISGWAPRVDKKNAIMKVNNSASGAIYKGIARAANGDKTLIYVTNFRSGQIEVYDIYFNRVQVTGGFSDNSLPTGYKPYGIHNINNTLYVTYVRPDAGGHHPLKRVGNGIVNSFDANGNFIKRIAEGNELNAPYGMTLAPANFGQFSNNLLIANNGDGEINAYGISRLDHRGKVLKEDNTPVSIDGLWSIDFLNGMNQQYLNTLFFTAGPFNGQHGLYGSIKAVGN